MEKEIFKQMSRFVELSNKFSKNTEEVFGKEDKLSFNTGYATLHVNGSSYLSTSLNCSFAIDGREIYIDSDGTLRAKDKLPLTRAEKIRAKAEVDAIIADEYDEYNSLRVKLQEYFKSVSNLTE